MTKIQVRHAFRSNPVRSTVEGSQCRLLAIEKVLADYVDTPPVIARK